MGFLLALTPIASFLIVARLLRPIPSWRRFGSWLRWASPLTLVLAVLFFATFDPTAAGDGAGIGGLTQRILIGEIQAWFAVMG